MHDVQHVNVYIARRPAELYEFAPSSACSRPDPNASHGGKPWPSTKRSRSRH